jgi:hypothetical protein
VDKLLILLAGLVFAVSIVCIVQAKQRAEATIEPDNGTSGTRSAAGRAITVAPKG